MGSLYQMRTVNGKADVVSKFGVKEMQPRHMLPYILGNKTNSMELSPS
jgi:hypothetical protein